MNVSQCKLCAFAFGIVFFAAMLSGCADADDDDDLKARFCSNTGHIFKNAKIRMSSRNEVALNDDASEVYDEVCSDPDSKWEIQQGLSMDSYLAAMGPPSGEEGIWDSEEGIWDSESESGKDKDRFSSAPANSGVFAICYPDKISAERWWNSDHWNTKFAGDHLGHKVVLSEEIKWSSNSHSDNCYEGHFQTHSGGFDENECWTPIEKAVRKPWFVRRKENNDASYMAEINFSTDFVYRDESFCKNVAPEGSEATSCYFPEPHLTFPVAPCPNDKRSCCCRDKWRDCSNGCRIRTDPWICADSAPLLHLNHIQKNIWDRHNGDLSVDDFDEVDELILSGFFKSGVDFYARLDVQKFDPYYFAPFFNHKACYDQKTLDIVVQGTADERQGKSCLVLSRVRRY